MLSLGCNASVAQEVDSERTGTRGKCREVGREWRTRQGVVVISGNSLRPRRDADLDWDTHHWSRSCLDQLVQCLRHVEQEILVDSETLGLSLSLKGLSTVENSANDHLDAWRVLGINCPQKMNHYCTVLRGNRLVASAPGESQPATCVGVNARSKLAHLLRQDIDLKFDLPKQRFPCQRTAVIALDSLDLM